MPETIKVELLTNQEQIEAEYCFNTISFQQCLFQFFRIRFYSENPINNDDHAT